MELVEQVFQRLVRAGGDTPGDNDTMAERLARTRENAEHQAEREPQHGPTEALRNVHAHTSQDTPETQARHGWVLTTDGRVPGLLGEWRRTPEGGYLGRVIHRQRGNPGSSSWVTVGDWLPANRVQRA